MTMFLGILCILAGFTAAAAEASGRRRTYGAAKMIAATAYIAFALSLGATTSGYGRLVLLALGLSWLGDLLLTGRAPAPFLAGLAAFLLAHVTYAVAFAARGVASGPALLAAVGTLAVSVVVFRWLGRAELPRRMRGPVALYLAAISGMVGLAAGTAWRTSGPAVGDAGPGVGTALLAGAVLFAASDVLVARERFVRSEPVNRLVGLPLYLVAQLLLASSVA